MTSVELAHSPSNASQHSYVSPEAIMEAPIGLVDHHHHHHHAATFVGLPEHPASPAKSVASQYNTPPELSQSSSPPPTTRFFDLDPNSSGLGDDSSTLEELKVPSVVATSCPPPVVGHHAMAGTLTVGMGDQDDEMLLKAFADDEGLLQLDRDPSMLMMSKFDEEFDNAVNMFTNSDEMFFGNP
jgi:regulatory protein SWI5